LHTDATCKLERVGLSPSSYIEAKTNTVCWLIGFNFSMVRIRRRAARHAHLWHRARSQQQRLHGWLCISVPPPPSHRLIDIGNLLAPAIARTTTLARAETLRAGGAQSDCSAGRWRHSKMSSIGECRGRSRGPRSALLGPAAGHRSRIHTSRGRVDDAWMTFTCAAWETNILPC
jgi:hypothetical protein